MATARELLEQADALMRRNRARLDDDIPVLTDAVDVADEPVPGPRTEPVLPEAAVASSAVAAGSPLAAPTLDDIPLLTDAVEEIEALSIQESVDSEGEPSDWLDIGRNETSVIGDAPDSIAMVPPVAHSRHPIGAERNDSGTAVPAAATVTQVDAADAGFKEIERAKVQSAGIESAELEPSELESTELESAELESAELESAELESTELESTELESTELESAELESAELESAEVESAELESAELESTATRPADFGSADFELAERESIEAATTELELADVEFAEPEPMARKFAAIAPEHAAAPEAGLTAAGFAGGSFGISAADDIGPPAAEFYEVEYTGTEMADHEVLETAVDDAEFTDTQSEKDEVLGTRFAASSAGAELPAETPHGAAEGMPAAADAPSMPVLAATTLLARGAAALLHGARALLGGQSSPPPVPPTPSDAPIESTALPEPDATPHPVAAPAPTVAAPAAMDTMPFEGMAPESATHSAVSPRPAAIDAGVVRDSAASMSEAAALAPPAEDGSMPAAPLEDTAPSFPAETTPGGTDTATLAVSASAPIDAAQWDAMAEEIRMQVLQRIDLFTDTGLRAQLGARLQPVVDRASADLVATINQHVGEILRAYVAEAIEREIDNWRRDH